MKATPIIVLLLVSTVGTALGQGGTPMQGVWERTFVRVILPDTTVEEHFREPPRLTKILTPTHFAFGRQTDDGEEVFAGGGTYTYSDGSYVERSTYHSNPSVVGRTITFESTMEDDSLWHISGIIGRFRLEETWRRIK